MPLSRKPPDCLSFSRLEEVRESSVTMSSDLVALPSFIHLIVFSSSATLAGGIAPNVGSACESGAGTDFSVEI